MGNRNLFFMPEPTSNFSKTEVWRFFISPLGTKRLSD